MRNLLLIISILFYAGCFSSSGSTKSGTTPSVSNWQTSVPYTGSSVITPVSIAVPSTVISTIDKSDSVIESEISAALAKGGIITFNTGGTKRTIILSKQLYIPVQGNKDNDYSSPVVIDGGGNITLDGGSDKSGNGGTRILEKGWKVNLTLQNIDFQNSNAANISSGRGDDSRSGGTVNVENWDGSLTIINCDFTNCRAAASGPDIGGGAVRCPGQKFVRIYNCSFKNCSGSNGGAINSLGSELWLLKCSFSDCSATGTGGGAEVSVTGQGGIGGAVYIDGISNNSATPLLRIEQCSFVNNSSNCYGGAVFLYTYEKSNSKTYIKDSLFSENSAVSSSAYGGALYSQNGQLHIYSSTFSKNTSGDMGGGIWHLSSETAFIGISTFSENTSGNFGSAIQANGPLYISGSTFDSNTCLGEYGGAIRSGTPDKSFIKNSIISNNQCKNPLTGNASEPLNDGGGNIQWPENTSHIKATANISFANPMFMPLDYNGGFTPTLMPNSDSSAAGKGTTQDAFLTDQRGIVRTAPYDPGAIEIR